jgi:hypothetical protein
MTLEEALRIYEINYASEVEFDSEYSSLFGRNMSTEQENYCGEA